MLISYFGFQPADAMKQSKIHYVGEAVSFFRTLLNTLLSLKRMDNIQCSCLKSS